MGEGADRRVELDLACGGDRQEIDCRIEQVAREHSVSSRMTSWVAVAEEPSVDPRDPVRIERIPQVLPYGMSVEGLGLIGPTSSLGQFAAAPAADFLAFRSDDVRFSPKPIERRGMRDSTLPELAAQLGQRLERRSEIAQQRAETLRRFAKDIWLASGELRDCRVSGGYEDAVAAGRSLVDRLTRLKEALYEIGDSGSVNQLMNAVDQLRELVEFELREIARPVSLSGRMLPSPGGSTTTVEIFTESGIYWHPGRQVTCGGRQVAVVLQGTTRSGPIAPGSVLRIELAARVEVLAAAGRLEIRTDDGRLIVSLAAE